MSNATDQQSNLFSFMVVRSPKTVTEQQMRRSYISDECILDNIHGPANLFSPQSGSSIGRLVYEEVFCPEQDESEDTQVEHVTTRTQNLEIVEAAIALLPKYYAPCDTTEPPETGQPIALETLNGRNYFEQYGWFYVIPERLSDAGISWHAELRKALDLIRNAGNTAEIRALPGQLAKLFEAEFEAEPLYKIVFYESGHHPAFLAVKRALFDNLYLLYVLRRAFSLSLEETIEGLRALHIIEALAIDGLLAELRTNVGTDAANEGVYAMLQTQYPALSGWNFRTAIPGFPLVSSRARLREMLDATPVIHPLFARLHYFRDPFNTIKPIGIGDLKVVKQTSLGYTAGDIAHIDNVLKSELKTRTHRRLEKSEDTFSFSSEERSESQRDTQSTERFELKRETESVLNTVLNVNANASVTYNNMPVVATVSGGVAYTRTSNDVAKIASNFARETVDKAVQKLESRVSQQRSSTRLLETEETNVHTFDNKEGTEHVSGIYHWVDRHYRSQVYNFGKRLMFEFVVPEPAAFFVESRLCAFESMLDVPQPPPLPAVVALPAHIATLRADIATLQMAQISEEKFQISEEKFRSLQLKYDLSEFNFPKRTKKIELVNAASGNNYFHEQDIIPTKTWQARTYAINVDAKDYRIAKILVSGYIFYWGKDGSWSDVASNHPEYAGELNTFELRIDGQTIINATDNTREYWFQKSENFVVQHPWAISENTLNLFFGFWDVSTFRLSVHAELTYDDDALYTWWTGVYRKVLSIEQAKIDDINEQRQQIYAAEMSRYKARLSEVKAAAVSELLRGQSSAANRQVIIDELKKHCISMIAKEFDANYSDDTLSSLDAIGSLSMAMTMRPFRINERGTETTAGYTTVNDSRPFPSIQIDTASIKGRYVQFLEQAFEWQQIAFLFYPYFWASPGRWVDTMSRQDPSDPQFTAFLQAGSVRVLVAVTPAYEDAVTHFIATGEPWDGGPAPVIGDPLFLPIHDELRRQQDDLFGGTPDGDPWYFTLPTALVYLQNSSTPLPTPPAPTPPTP
mgnify:CR=1 FL=1